MLPFFKLELSDDPETGVDMLGLVELPAHMKDFVSFSENKEDDKPKVKQYFNEEQMIITGVMISEGTPIYRNDPEIGEHYVLFDKSTIAKAQMRFMKNQYLQNVNLDHDPKKKIEDGIFMFESYIVNSKEGVNAPAKLGQIVRDGSWVASYKVTSTELWQKIKSGVVNGFSIEGFFERVPVNVKTNFTKDDVKGLTTERNLLNQLKMGIKEKILAIFSEEETVESTMGTATTDTGEELSYEGELAIGTLVTISIDGEPTPAPEGVHMLTGEFEGFSIVLDADGVVTDIVEPDLEVEEQPEGEIEEAVEEMAKAFAKKLAKLEKSNKKLIEKNGILAETNAEIKKTFNAQIEKLTERLSIVEKAPIVEPKKKHNRTESRRNAIPQNPIINNL